MEQKHERPLNATNQIQQSHANRDLQNLHNIYPNYKCLKLEQLLTEKVLFHQVLCTQYCRKTRNVKLSFWLLIPTALIYLPSIPENPAQNNRNEHKRIVHLHHFYYHVK